MKKQRFARSSKIIKKRLPEWKKCDTIYLVPNNTRAREESLCLHLHETRSSTLFLQLLDERPLSKITVKDIVDACGVNRNTFYYHFEDIPALIEAISKKELDTLIQEHTRVDSIEDCLMISVDSILKRRRMVLHLYNSNNRDFYERELMDICQYLVATYFDSKLAGRRIDPEDRDILLRSYRCWCFGLLVDWLSGGLKEDVKPNLKRLCELYDGAIENVVARCRVIE